MLEKRLIYLSILLMESITKLLLFEGMIEKYEKHKIKHCESVAGR
jgi:hypothetical protein